MSQRPSKEEYNAYYEQYIGLMGEMDIIDALEAQLESTRSLLVSVTEEQGNYRYAAGKWSLKEVIGHISDNERVMSYRLLRAARGDKTQLPGYEQDHFIQGSSFHDWSMEQTIEDYRSVRRATLTLLRGLSDEAWTRLGAANNSNISVRALAYIIAGHELHHMRFIQERYLQ
ncbi:DinB family protein [Paenibacillus sp. sgz302251]|uniref:DinB family protein n=1 Tax=Paenibacillus sp. sgz302251 TaxID=3414493 RepID=UPI003C7B1BFB